MKDVYQEMTGSQAQALNHRLSTWPAKEVAGAVREKETNNYGGPSSTNMKLEEAQERGINSEVDNTRMVSEKR